MIKADHERERDRGDASQSESVEPANRGPRLLPQLPVQPGSRKANPSHGRRLTVLGWMRREIYQKSFLPRQPVVPRRRAYFLTRRRHHVSLHIFQD